MKKMNMAIWGAVLLLLGICLTAAATSESDLTGAALAFTSTLVLSASFLLNLLGVIRNRTNNRVMMFVIGFFIMIINMFVYMYSLITGIAKVSLYGNGWALFIFATIIPAVLALIFAIKAGMPSTRDKTIRRHKPMR